jgi:BMFP domain-containing protein YqiC
MARDNELLAERAQIMDHLAQASQSFGQQVQSQGQLMGELSAQLRASAIEVASLGESFGAAVQTLHQTQDQTLAQLQQLEAALGQSINRSDEQMAYYVAQAREVIELSLAAQKPMIESLERVSRRLSPEEA